MYRYFLRIAKFPYYKLIDKLRKACVTKSSLIHAFVSIKHQFVIDRQTDGHRTIANTALAWRHAGKNSMGQ